MAKTHDLISSVTVGSGGAATISFTSIPQTYTDLILELSSRGESSVNRIEVYVKINNNTSSIYSSRRIQGYDSNSVLSAQSTEVAPTSNGSFGRSNGNTSTANTFGSLKLYIPNYTSSNNKSMSVDWVQENNSSTDWSVGFSAASWASSSAITELVFSAESGLDFAQHSTAYLYGIKNS